MTLIRPFAGLRPAPGRAADVLAPPYDVLSRAEAVARAAGRPWSFLHISRPEIDLPETVSPYDDAVYARGAENLAGMLAAGVLVRDPGPVYYAYRLEMDGHVQTGLVAAASLPAYDANIIRRHEHTRPDKEDDRVRQIEALDAQTGPVLLAHRVHDGLRERLRAACSGEPAADVTADDGVRHTLWVIDDAHSIEAITALFDPSGPDGLDALYIADGHHRSAAASRVAARRRERAGASWSGDCEGFLAVLFQADELRVLDYNRVVYDLNGLDRDGFLRRVGERFAVTPCDGEARPERPGQFGMYLPGQWYRLEPAGPVAADDPVAGLDVSLLADHLIAPVLGIDDPRRDGRIDFVGGIRGLGELARRVDDGEMAVAFALHPTTLEQLMTVADAGEVMPPKSTWFEPKLADGMVSYPLCRTVSGA
ncbi:MAG: DUF1015 family protein [Gammaproteobacteria bacterium]|nr:DUF1015 family protein [Gammaproteobacteria bacterium]